MARAASKAIMGFLAIEPHHHPAIVSLVAPANPSVRMLDPFAGNGEFLDYASSAWNVTPYANELDGERAENCIARFGPKQAVRGDAERLVASANAFGIAWLNPPYDHDKLLSGNKRIEFAFLKHSWKWVQEGGIALWCVYRHHITEDAALFLSKNASRVDVWGLPGKHLGEYDQIVVVAIKGNVTERPELYEKILTAREWPRVLTMQRTPLYKIPAPQPIRRFVFAPDVIDPEQGLRLIETQGAWKHNGFQALMEIPRKAADIEPVVAPRPGHMALVLAAGIANGAVIDTEKYGRVAIRGKITRVETIARVEVKEDPNDPEREITTTVEKIKPETTLTLLSAEGTTVEIQGDDPLLDFITSNKPALAAYLNTKFQPMYEFDFAGIGGWLHSLRLNGKYPLYTAQKHVVGAAVRGFQSRDSILLVGQMGVGKTALGSSTAIALAGGIVQGMQAQCRPDQVTLIVAPPHLIQKWKREIQSLSKAAYIEQLDRHEDVKAFMERAALLGPKVAKIGLIKRDLTKLGSPHEPAVVWRNHYTVNWSHRYTSVPYGMTGRSRIEKIRTPRCPHCGAVVMRELKGSEVVASETWLRQGKRSCGTCNTPLWREAREKSSMPKDGELYPSKNPRYRLDQYIKRMYPDRVFLLIWDEVHEAQHGDTGNGEAFGRLAGVAKKVLAMTGTPFNGRASSIFNLEYAINPRVRQHYNWGGSKRYEKKERGSREFQTVIPQSSDTRGRAEAAWVAEMGVLERTIEERPTYDRMSGRYTGTEKYQRPYEEAPGISPMLVAEILDHAIFFSLGDLGKALPEYQEIAMPISLDEDIGAEYDRVRTKLKEYMIKRRWEGDNTFRGAYLQWSMGWPNAAFRPMEIIHNIKNLITGNTEPCVVEDLPSFGEDRIYAKEQALIDLLRKELAENRPCVIYVRQTSTRDIQPRLEELIKLHVPGAVPYVLRNTVSADRREAVINAQVAAGANVIISNPELVKTGLDLIFAPTLIFYEIVFNLGTMMQAAARSFRLNQEHELCKTYYMYAEGTMEATAVHLMSRKQRAAKLLTGDIGLTGLDAITEGEGGLEEALLAAIGRDDSLIDPSSMFKKAEGAYGEINAEDAAYWNTEDEEPAVIVVPARAEPKPMLEPEPISYREMLQRWAQAHQRDHIRNQRSARPLFDATCPIEVLRNCTWNAKALTFTLPDVQLERDVYESITVVMEAFGGKWEGGITNAFVFETDVQAKVDRMIKDGKLKDLNLTNYSSTLLAIAAPMTHSSEKERPLTQLSLF